MSLDSQVATVQLVHRQLPCQGQTKSQAQLAGEQPRRLRGEQLQATQEEVYSADFAEKSGFFMKLWKECLKSQILV